MAQIAFAQKGKIRGTAYERSNGEPMFCVQIFVPEVQSGGVTDFDGKFEVELAPGTYTLQAKFIGFTTVNISDVVVKAGEVTVIEAIWLEEAVSELDEIIVTAEALRSTDVALLQAKRKATNLIDGISSQQIKRYGDSDVAGAIKRVPGVSIQGGQYVFVRGLGDRYTKTILNRMEVPGLDPDRNAIQIDIFPTSLIDNIIVYKNFTPDLSADFVGGTVNIETKDFPDEKTMTLSLGLEYNSSMHFRNDFLTYNGGGTDFLGFDDGKRDLPFDGRTGNIPSPLRQDQALNDITSSFAPNMSALTDSNLANLSLGFSLGDQR
ncbi:TonB-dependent receptor [bacterium]|nr:TonB-dependent receptor [bacterium]